MLKYTYLLINLTTVFFPVALSFDQRVQFYKSWKYILPGIVITGCLFLGWDVLFTVKGVWSFNAKYITGITLFHLPVEEILFFLTVPFACIFIYSCLNYYVIWQLSKQLTTAICNALLIFSALQLFYHHDRLYTLVTFGLLPVLLVLLEFVFKVKWLGKFYLAYVVSLIPFYIVNGILTAIPIVMYNNVENSGYRVGTIPLEDHFYSMCLLLMNIAFFEQFRKEKTEMLTERKA